MYTHVYIHVYVDVCMHIYVQKKYICASVLYMGHMRQVHPPVLGFPPMRRDLEVSGGPTCHERQRGAEAKSQPLGLDFRVFGLYLWVVL